MISPGSMLNTSEGLFTTATNAMMSATLATDAAWQVQVAAVVMAGLVTMAYVLGRGKTKAGGAGE